MAVKVVFEVLHYKKIGMDDIRWESADGNGVDVTFIHPVLSEKVKETKIEKEMVIPLLFSDDDTYILDGHHRLAKLLSQQEIEFEFEFEFEIISKSEYEEKLEFAKKLVNIYRFFIDKEKEKFIPLCGDGECVINKNEELMLSITNVFSVEEPIETKNFTLAVMKGSSDQTEGWMNVYILNVNVGMDENWKVEFDYEFIRGEYYENAYNGNFYYKGSIDEEDFEGSGIDEEYIISELPRLDKKNPYEEVSCGDVDYYIDDVAFYFPL